MKITSLFISSESKSSDVLVDFCSENNIQCLRKSLIGFQAVPFEVIRPFDVVFFTSPRSFDFFTAQFSLSRDAEIACIGEETKKHIKKAGFSVSFYGVEAGKPERVALELKAWLNDKHVLIPQSTRSNKSIEAILDVHQFTPLVVYKTILKPQIIPEVSVYVFTSPSNVESFLQKNTISKSAQVIAWGETTNQFLLKNEIFSLKVLNQSTYLELIQFLSNFSE